MQYVFKEFNCLGRTEEWGFRNLYSALLSLGFSCNQSLDSQLVPGNVPRFEFIWKNGKSFSIQRRAAYDAPASYWDVQTPSISDTSVPWNCRVHDYPMTNPVSESDNNRCAFGFELFYDDANFMLFGGGQYSIYDRMCSEYVVGAIHDSKGQFQYTLSGLPHISGSSPNFIDMIPLTYRGDYIQYIGEDGISRYRSLKLPRDRDTFIYISDFIISTGGCKPLGDDFGRKYLLKDNKESVVLDQIKSCSYITPRSTVLFGGDRWAALDSYTLVRLDTDEE